MAEWIVEDGVGERRAALIEDNVILEAIIEWDDIAWPLGTVTPARIGEIDRARGQGFVTLPDGTFAILSPLPSEPLSQGRAVTVEIIREPIAEGRRNKWPKVRLANTPPGPPRSLRDRLNAHAAPGHGPDLLEAAGWSEMIEEGVSGQIAFPGGTLHLSLTPAMTLFDVDGTLPRGTLAIAGASAAGYAIRRLGIGGNIGIDLPTTNVKADRNAAAAALDAALPPPFERTAVNGFGFLQIIRRRTHRSIPEMLTADPEGAALRLLLRRAERCGGSGAIRLTAAPALIARLEARPDWLADLARRTGRRIDLQPEAGIATWSGHADAETP